MMSDHERRAGIDGRAREFRLRRIRRNGIFRARVHRHDNDVHLRSERRHLRYHLLRIHEVGAIHLSGLVLAAFVRV